MSSYSKPGPKNPNWKGGISKIRTADEKNQGAILTEKQARDIKKRVEKGEVQRRLAEEYGVGKNAINDLVKRRTWRYL